MYQIIKQFSERDKNNKLIKYCLIETKYGLCKQNFQSFKKGNLVTINAAINKKEYFQNQSNEIHNFKYEIIGDYVNNSVKINIKCSVCENLFSQTPINHLHQVSGCPKCSIKNKPQCIVLTTKQFIEKAIETHADKYDYSLTNYKNCSSKVKIICKTHGIFEQSPVYHVQGSNCPLCSGKYKTTNKILNQFKEKHGDKYLYPDFKLTKMHAKISIICSIHGEFKQSVNNHKRGAGCISCHRVNTGWTKTKFIAKCKEHNKGIFYVIKCFNETETFYKFGITSNSVKKRYNSKREMPYNFEIIHEISDLPENVFNYELFLKNTIDSMKIKYIPEIKFAGCLSECVKLI